MRELLERLEESKKHGIDFGPYSDRVIVVPADKTRPGELAVIVPGFKKGEIRKYLERKSSTPHWSVAERDFITMGGKLSGARPSGKAQKKAAEMSLSGSDLHDYSVLYLVVKDSDMPPWHGSRRMAVR